MTNDKCVIKEFVASDGYRWKYRHYKPEGSPRAHVICIHGVQSHGGWYEYSCDQLRQTGLDVYFLDRRGSGMNEPSRGDAPSYRRLLDDLAEFLSSLSSSTGGLRPPLAAQHSALSTQHPSLPTPHSPLPAFLVAISWGGKLAAALERRHPGLIEGLALLCPGFFPRVKPTLSQRLAIAFARLFRPRKRFEIPLNDPELFTTSPRWQNFLRDDLLGLRQATSRFLVESVRLDRYLRLAPKYVRVPVLLLLAEKDRIIHNGRTRSYVERFASTDKEIIEYPGAHHTLEFEPEPDRFVQDLIGWLNRQIEKREQGLGIRD